VTAGLPPALDGAIERLLDGVSRADLAERSARISGQYRSGGASKPVVTGQADAVAYALSRLPATYAAVDAAMAAVEQRAPGFAPASLLDVGAGPGGASWAAVERWPGIEAVSFLDSNPAFLDLATRLASASGHAGLAGGARLSGDFLAPPPGAGPADLVVASYALAEAGVDQAAETARRLWGLCSGVLLVVEPGTPAGFERILAMRSALIAAGGEVIAPCPHAAECPMQAPGWCHFGRRLPRSRDHRLVKGASAPFEDEKFAYVAVGRPGIGGGRPGERALSTPRVSKIGVAYRACAPNGLVDRQVSRRERDRFAKARRLDWGDWVEEG
jgi:ribosomal protein RSM22 (predicted rRNA methylase)